MSCLDKISPEELGVIAALFSLIGSFVTFILAITLLNNKNAEQNTNKANLSNQIQNLQGQLDLVQRRLK